MRTLEIGRTTINLDCDRRRCQCWCHTSNAGTNWDSIIEHTADCQATTFPNAKARRALDALR